MIYNIITKDEALTKVVNGIEAVWWVYQSPTENYNKLFTQLVSSMSLEKFKSIKDGFFVEAINEKEIRKDLEEKKNERKGARR